MRALMILPVAAAALALGCTRPAVPQDDASFAREVAGRVAGAPANCIDSHQSSNLRVVDSRTLAYDDGRTLWITRLAAACPVSKPLARSSWNRSSAGNIAGAIISAASNKARSFQGRPASLPIGCRTGGNSRKGLALPYTT